MPRQEKFKSLFPSYLRHADAIFIVLDTGAEVDFESLSKEINYVKECTNNARVVVVGNKADQGELYDRSELKDWMEKLEADYVEVSAKTGMNIQQLLGRTVEAIHSSRTLGDMI